MTNTQHLLTDAQVQSFITDGYLLIHTDFATPLHQHIYDALEDVFAKEGNVGNNILPRIPEIARVFDHPNMRGALTSLLGPDYILNPHRHCHLNPLGSKGQTWHKDCYVFDHNMRQPRFHWLLALYYPQDVSEDMGPTGILPGVQNWETISDPDPQHCREEALPLTGAAGTIALVHFDAWHRAMPNLSDKKRYMLKFQFARMQRPTAPTWNCQSTAWTPDDAHPEVSLDVWNWLCGKEELASPTADDTASLLERLEKGTEAQRLRAAYALGPYGEKTIADLLSALRREARAVDPRVEAKTPDNAHGTNPTALRAAQALVATGPTILPHLIKALTDEHWLVRTAIADVLATLGPTAGSAVPALTKALTDEHWWVRRGAAEALGRMGTAAHVSVPALVDTLPDDDRRVRRATALALAQLRTYSDDAENALTKVLSDEDRYNRFHAGMALRRIDHPNTREALLDALFTARWCPVTTAENMF
ncbi:MAG: HEAT repeat domain-containing protein [Candidatus Latescibacterota bacterium]|nr:HEAT repeat domain-containing protein [Candidatus Latescibacterota bacterium]